MSVIYLGVALILLSLPLSLWKVLGMLAFLLIRSFIIRRRSAIRYLLSPISLSECSVSTEDDDQWLLTDKKGQSFLGQLKADSFITTWVIILNFRVKNHYFNVPVVIFSDALDKDTFRQLRVQLLLH